MKYNQVRMEIMNRNKSMDQYFDKQTADIKMQTLHLGSGTD
jgi:hypothetical protein